MEIFDSSLNLLEKSIELRSKRSEILASNIANRDTPNYKASDLVFEKQLQNAYYNNGQTPLKTTDPRHFTGLEGSQNLTDVKGQAIFSFNPEARFDGNTVDLDQEMAKISTNQLLFESTTRGITRKLQILKDAVVEGGR